jgi:hypothetical protein
LLLLSRLDEHASLIRVLGSLVVTGVGQATFQPANNSALMGAAPPGREGTASGVLATDRVIGQSLSVATAGAMFTSLGAAAAGRALARGAPAATMAPIFVHGLRLTLIMCACMTMIAALASALRGPEKRARA